MGFYSYFITFVLREWRHCVNTTTAFFWFLKTRPSSSESVCTVTSWHTHTTKNQLLIWQRGITINWVTGSGLRLANKKTKKKHESQHWIGINSHEFEICFLTPVKHRTKTQVVVFFKTHAAWYLAPRRWPGSYSESGCCIVWRHLQRWWRCRQVWSRRGGEAGSVLWCICWPHLSTWSRSAATDTQTAQETALCEKTPSMLCVRQRVFSGINQL